MNDRNVTREMLTAAHREAMKNGDVILSSDLLARIYKAMAAIDRPQPARAWVGLTGFDVNEIEERLEAWAGTPEVIRATEAALREKNAPEDKS